MKVTLNIENDKELRAHIKDCVKGQVLGIVREDFLAIVKEELERKLKGTNTALFDRMVRDSLKQAIKDLLRQEHGVGQWKEEFIKPFVENVVSSAIAGKDWNKLVDTLAKEKVKSLLK